MLVADPGYPLQQALAAQLLADAGVTALVGARVLDALSATAQTPLPYIEIGEVQTVGQENTVADASEVFVTLHVWATGAAGNLIVSRIANAVRQALDPLLTVPGHVVDTRRYDGARRLTDPDGLTAHGVLTYRYLTHPAA